MHNKLLHLAFDVFHCCWRLWVRSPRLKKKKKNLLLHTSNNLSEKICFYILAVWQLCLCRSSLLSIAHSFLKPFLLFSLENQFNFGQGERARREQLTVATKSLPDLTISTSRKRILSHLAKGIIFVGKLYFPSFYCILLRCTITIKAS